MIILEFDFKKPQLIKEESAGIIDDNDTRVRWCCPTQPGRGASVGGTTTAGAGRDVSGGSADTRNYTTIYTDIYT